MLRLGKAGSVVFSELRSPVCTRPTFSFVSWAITRRAFSSSMTTTEPRNNDLFNYTSGRWVYNDALRHKERKVAFNVNGICQLAAEALNQSPKDVIGISKLAEGGFNRTLVVSMRDGRRVVARVPYPMAVTRPYYYALASEVATMVYLKTSCGVPLPQVYGYSARGDNIAETPYILMEFVDAPKLSEVWRSLGDDQVVSVMRQIGEMEARMMERTFPAGGSLYFTEDLERVASGVGVPLEEGDGRFCVGPDTRLALWYGRRVGLDVDRGPYRNAQATLDAAARKEIAYLKHFGRPLLPLRRERRPGYKYQKQSPSDHVKNLERYLSITSSLVPKDPALSRFYIRHPDLHPNNIFVSWSGPGGSGDCKIISVFDWQHTAILPMFLLAGIPQRFQNYADEASQSTTPLPPSRPENLDEMGEARRESEEYRYRCRLVHYQYLATTMARNPLHYAALTDPLYALRGRLFLYAGAPWEGESFDLKAALIEAKDQWGELSGGSLSGSGDSPCPLEFDTTELDEMEVLDRELAQATRGFEILQSMRGVGEDGWVWVEDYEDAVAFFKACKEDALAGAQSAEEREEVLDHWPWDDMDEDAYM